MFHVEQHTWSEVVPRAAPLKTQLWEIALDRAVKMNNEKQKLKRLYALLLLARPAFG